MAKLLSMPRLGETMEQGTMRSWLVKPGVPYKRGDVIAEIETDKTVVELPALEDGMVERFLAQDGDVVTVGAPLAELAGEASSGVASGAAPSRPAEREKGIPKGSAQPPFAPEAPEPSVIPAGRRPDEGARGGRYPASPAARRLARQHGIDLAAIPATGRQGRVQGWDVRAALASHSALGTSEALHFALRGEGSATPVVLLHGFGGDKDSWLSLAVPLAQHRKVVSIDLPGHGGSLIHPARDAEAMARAVLSTLRQLEIKEAHLIGHSLGGAVALSAAIANSALAASLTLFAPGGVGPGINGRLLARFAAATSEAEIAIVLDQFFGPDSVIPRGLAAAIATTRKTAGTQEALKTIAAAMLEGTGQRMIPAERIAALEMPLRVIWGEDDHVLPMTNAHRFPGIVAIHRYRRIGHMPQIEIGRDALKLVQLNITAR